MGIASSQITAHDLSCWIGMQNKNMILIGGIPTPLKNMNVNLDDYFQYMEKYKMFQTTNQDVSDTYFETSVVYHLIVV